MPESLSISLKVHSFSDDSFWPCFVVFIRMWIIATLADHVVVCFSYHAADRRGRETQMRTQINQRLVETGERER